MPSPEAPLPLPSPLPPRPLRPALKVRLEPLHRTLRFPWRPLTPIVSSSSPFSALLLDLLCLISTCPGQARTTPIFPSVSQMGPRTVQGLPKVSGLSRAGIRTRDTTPISLLPSPDESPCFLTLSTCCRCFVFLGVSLFRIVTFALLLDLLLKKPVNQNPQEHWDTHILQKPQRSRA